jgi:outer membrane lipoprotein SlyB
MSVALGLLATIATATAIEPAAAQRAGQSVNVRVGSVTESQPVDLKDGNALKGAVLGGAVGSAVTKSSKGSSRRDRNAAIGAVLGARAAANKQKPGRIYSVAISDGGMVRIATEQTEIQVGDCVYVEQTSSTANIRRAPLAVCEPANKSILGEPEIVSEMQEEAGECIAAKQELVDAEDDVTIDRAIRKIQFLCYD